MVRNNREYLNTRKRKAYLEDQLMGLADASPDDESTLLIREDLGREIANLERELGEYEDLSAGSVSEFVVESLDELGEALIKARIAKGLSHAALAYLLGMEPQQVQRYERNDWQKISLWRLQEVIEALELRFSVRVHLSDDTTQWRQSGEPEMNQPLAYGYPTSQGIRHPPLSSVMGNTLAPTPIPALAPAARLTEDTAANAFGTAEPYTPGPAQTGRLNSLPQ